MCLPALVWQGRLLLIMRKQLPLLSKYQTSLGLKQTSGRCINKGARRSSVCTLPSRSWVTGLHYSPSHQHADQKGCACDRREEEISCRQSCNGITRIFQSNTLGHHSTHSHCRERGDTDSSKVWETLGVITMRFDYIANTTAVQLHLK